jgi:hypothetical protein
MRLVVLDEFPAWQIYTLAVAVLCGFLVALTLLIRSYLVSSRSKQVSQLFAWSGRQSWFFTIAGALGLWFLGASMYLRFHAMVIGPRRLELVYFWPRPPESIPIEDLVRIELAAAYRSCGHVEVTSRYTLHRSVNFRDCKIAAAIHDQLIAQYGLSLKE